jgi:uncharacterized protein YegL
VLRDLCASWLSCFAFFVLLRVFVVLILVIGLAGLPPSAHAQATEQENVDVVLVVDISGSMLKSDPEAIRVSAVRLFLDLSRDGDRIAVVGMGGDKETEVKIKLTRLSSWLDATDTGRRQLKEELGVLAQAPGQQTFMGKALDLAYDVLDQAEPGRQQYVVMLTDGRPTGEAAKVLTDALARFEHKRFWKIFPVALGPEPDFAFLQNKVAAPTNGIAFKAATPADLIRVYTEIFALTRQNHYVNWVKVQPGVLQTLGTVAPEQQITHLAVVIPKGGRQPDVEVLVAPNGRNLVDPAQRGGLYWAEDPRYEVYVVPRQSLSPEGLWRIRLNNPAEVEIALLARSNLAIQLRTPAPRAPWEELSERYHPADEPLYVQMGVQRHLTGIEAIQAEFEQEQGISSAYQLFLTPVVKLGQLTDRPLMLRDDGLFSDYVRDDGAYGGRTLQPLPAGRYEVEFEVPSLKPDTLRLVKQRTVEALALPRIRLKLPAGPLSPGPLTLEAAFSSVAGSTPTLNEALMFWIREPDGRAYSLPAVQTGELYRVQINVTQAGKHQIGALASVTTQMEARAIPYTTYDEAELVVVKPEIVIQAQETALGQHAGLGDLRVRVQITSRSVKAETLSVRVTGLGDAATVVPAAVAVGPQETKAVELSVGTSALAAAGPGTFALVFSAGDAATVVNESVSFSYEVVQGIQVSSLKTDLGKLAKLSDLKVQLWARSASVQPETLAVRVEGLGEKAQVFPATLQVPAQEETAFTLMIQGAKAAKGPGQFEIVLQPTSSSVAVSPARIPFSYELAQGEGGGGIGGLLITVVLVLIVVGLVAFLVLRRRR